MFTIDLEINPCSSSPCENGGICENTLDGNYTCGCKSQWTGINCETGECFVVEDFSLLINPCSVPRVLVLNLSVFILRNQPLLNFPMWKRRHLHNTLDRNYACFCETQWTGNNCEVGEFECVSSPYNILATTFVSKSILALIVSVEKVLIFPSEVEHVFNSSWHFSTTTVSVHPLEINPCASSPCGNDGTCVNAADGNYACICKTQWTGSDCGVGEC